MGQNAPDGTVIRMPDGSMRVKRGAEWLPTGKLYSGPGPKLAPQEQKTIATARTEAEKADGVIADVNRFSALNRKQGSGGILGLPGFRNLHGALDPEVGEMNAITNRLTPAQREAGSGAMSDKDVEMFRASVVGQGNYGNTNAKIGNRSKAGAMRQRDYAAFLDYFAKVNGTINGAQEAWDDYKTAEPIYDPKTGDVRQGRSWRAYYGLPERSGGAPRPTAPAGGKAPPKVTEFTYDAQGRRVR